MGKGLSFGLGVTLYSFNVEYYTYKYTMEELLELVGSLGPAQGVEVVGPQMIRSFPEWSDEFEKRFKNAVEKYDLRPTCYGAYPDPQRITGRWLTREEQSEYLKTQIRNASKLGFPVIRMVATKDLLADLVPYAEKYNVKMGIEIHAPMMIENKGQMIDMIKKVDSPYLGIIPDCGAFCRTPADVYINRFLDQGVPRDIVNKIIEMWKAKIPEVEMRAEIGKMGGDELAMMMMTESHTYFGHSDPKSMLAVMPYIVHIHGKFFNINENGYESAVRYPEIIATLQEAKYSHYMSCEYEGHHWVPYGDSLAQIKGLQALIRRQVENN
jgi:Sugar phosphate isomerases/epimerases